MSTLGLIKKVVNQLSISLMSSTNRKFNMKDWILRTLSISKLRYNKKRGLRSNFRTGSMEMLILNSLKDISNYWRGNTLKVNSGNKNRFHKACQKLTFNQSCSSSLTPKTGKPQKKIDNSQTTCLINTIKNKAHGKK